MAGSGKGILQDAARFETSERSKWQPERCRSKPRGAIAAPSAFTVRGF